MVTLRDARDVASSIVKTLNPNSIILFGSVARESSGADLDLLIVTDDELAKEGDADILLHKCLKKFYRRFAIDPYYYPVISIKRLLSERESFFEVNF